MSTFNLENQYWKFTIKEDENETGVKGMRTLVTYFTQTNNTEKIARSIYDEAIAQGHEPDMVKIENVVAESLSNYDIVFVGSACHDADLAQPVKIFLEGISPSPAFKMAGFVTHATLMGEDGNHERALYERWAGKCIKTFTQVSEDKGIEFLGYFHCMGVPVPQIADFIHREIILDEEEWKEYEQEVMQHPDGGDIRKAKAFTKEILLKCEANI